MTEYWMHRLGYNSQLVSEREVYESFLLPSGKILLVRNEQEMEIAQALQLLYGQEIDIAVSTKHEMYNWIMQTERVYTTFV